MTQRNRSGNWSWKHAALALGVLLPLAACAPGPTETAPSTAANIDSDIMATRPASPVHTAPPIAPTLPTPSP